jgi:hypothetical protein
MASKNVVPRLIEIDLSNVKISDPKTMDTGGKISYISLDKKPFIFQTPQMRAPYGLSDWQNEKFYLDLSFSDQEDVITFRQKLEEFEDMIIDAAHTNSVSWFKSSKSKATLKQLFTSSIKKKTDSSYPPTFKVSVPMKKGKFDCDAYNGRKEELAISKSTITGGSKVNAIIQCSGLWIAGAKFGCTYKIVQAKVITADNKVISGYSFIDDEDEQEMI